MTNVHPIGYDRTVDVTKMGQISLDNYYQFPVPDRIVSAAGTISDYRWTFNIGHGQVHVDR